MIKDQQGREQTIDVYNYYFSSEVKLMVLWV